MCPDNLTEFSRQDTPSSQQPNGVRTVTLLQVSGKKALQEYREKRRLQQENKENIPPILHKEEAFYQGDDKKDTEYVVKKETRHNDPGKHFPA